MNIPTFALFVIPMLALEAAVSAALPIDPYVGVESDVLASKAGDGPTLPQLRVAGELGLFFPIRGYRGISVSLGGMHVSPSVPADSILYRGYYGGFAATAITLPISGTKDSPFLLEIGGSCALARYSQTDLYFIAYAAQVAPAFIVGRGNLDLRLSLPFRAEFRGDGRSLSVGLALAFGRGRGEEEPR